MTKRHFFLSAAALLFLGAADECDLDTDGTDLEDARTIEEVCEPRACAECYSGDATCTYAGVSVTRASCNDCQAKAALIEELCEQGLIDDSFNENDIDCAQLADDSGFGPN